MKITETEMTHKMGNGSSYKVYICNTHETAMLIHQTAMTLKPEEHFEGWYYHVSTNECISDCRVPDFFHKHGYWMTVVEHNNGDWNKEPTYELFLVG